MKYRFIAFDVDGTLLDTERITLEALHGALRELEGLDIPVEELAFALGQPGAVSLAQMDLRDPAACLLRWQELEQDELIEGCAPFPGITETISALKARGCTLGLVTSRTQSEYEVDKTLTQTLAPWFSATVLAGMTEHPKPAPDPLLKFMDLTGATPEETLFVGDSVYDMQCAGAAGVDFALALWGTKNPEMPAAYHPSEPGELLRLV